MKRKDVLKLAKKAGAEVWEGGDHTRMQHPSCPEITMQLGRHNEIYGNQERNVRKWLIKIGALVCLVFIPAAYLLLGGCQASIA